MQKLDEPILYKLDSELSFILIEKIDFSFTSLNVINGIGKKYDYEDGFITELVGTYEIQLSLSYDGHGEVKKTKGVIL